MPTNPSGRSILRRPDTKALANTKHNRPIKRLACGARVLRLIITGGWQKVCEDASPNKANRDEWFNTCEDCSDAIPSLQLPELRKKPQLHAR